MSVHEGVSCDACGKSNFRSKRFKCLICYDYDLCATCYEQGEISSHHTREHPMQCILTHQDFDLYYHGERYTYDSPQSLTCPFCGDMGLSFPCLNESSSSNNIQNIDLFQHLQIKHSDNQQSYEVICPICASMINGESNLVTTDLISHIANDHQDQQVNTVSSPGGEINTYTRQTLPPRDYDFGINSGIRGGFRRGLLRTTIRRGASERGSGPISQHFVIDRSSGLPTVVSGNDPISNLLTQLSTVRRLAAANNNNNVTNTNSSLTSSPNTINLQTFARQQYERERLRAAGRSHHYHQLNHSQQSIPTSVESDFLDSFLSSVLLTDPSISPTNNPQTWARIVTQQQSTPEQQTSSKTKTPTTTTTTTTTTTKTNTESDRSLLRRMCDESTSSSLAQPNSTILHFIVSIKQTKTIMKMNNICFRIKTVLSIVIVLVTIINCGYSASVSKKYDDLFTINVTMNNYETKQEDEYAYVQHKLPDEELFIVGYSPLINMNSAHHMLSYACSEPGSDKPFWTGYGPCSGQQMIIHGWARNAPSFTLPEDVGIPVGRNTPYKYIVINIHYLLILKNDNSGNQLILTRKPRKYHAGVLLSGTGAIYLRPKTHTIRTPFSCEYNGPPISIFAARVHAHQWARVNSLYRVRNGEISQVVKGDPQWPQSFYPLPSTIEIQNKDYIVGQCVYDNNDDRIITAGSTHHDEMCNVYVMYSYDPKHDLSPPQMCWDNGISRMASLIPPDSEIPPLKPADISGTQNGHHAHAEHAMNSYTANDDQSYEDYLDEFENIRHRDKGIDNFDINKILSHLGLPDYEYVDAQNYDYLLPNHLTYGKGQTVKLHNAKLMRSNLYKSVENWPDIKSLPAQLGQVGGIALNNANDELIVFHRGSRKWEFKYFNGFNFRNEDYGPIEEDVLIHIDTRTGQTKFRWGSKKFYMPHGLTIDHEGNFWLTDIAMHQVFMFKPNDLNHSALIVGEMFKPGSGPNQLCRPADIAVMKNGDFFVADGYCNSRIIKFNRKGEYIMEWGSPMSGKLDSDGFPLPNEWNIVHSIALNEDAQLLCGADRENFRIQCFNSNTGEFQRQIRVEITEKIGAIYAIEFAPNTNGTILFAVTGGAQTSNKKVYMIDAQKGEILTSFDSNPHLNAPHDITVSINAREIYVGELASSPNNALRKFELSKQKDLPTQAFIKRINLNDKNFRISLIIMAAFAIPVLASVIIGCIIRIRNKRKIHRLNTFPTDVKNRDTSNSSFLCCWTNRRKGFKKVPQDSDGENEPSDTYIADDPCNSSGDGTITTTKKTTSNKI
ncbi:unnamed protein product [Rotaria sordida]|uniref:ZZ-type domain-containing protein n=1 Tax=Rotaria sordida TaxID=392033 RepID=A0A819BAG0_9BILA|nr:unnamed protein product [Rotaria sordida]